ncbi:MAG: nicotinate-nucleotide--dimethylbenzimidazole phosphoribosyltransferase [Candidatus Eremiobacteraeota bacterium]|nr:nicotinate-nucleotide--dimethylbenzimidazole phosphoribosyltransferase [Candidatus Eremiobacteraeota bacterium]
MTFHATVQPVSREAAALARERIDQLTKPVGSLGRIEELAERLAAIARMIPTTNYERRVIVIGAGDHGVTQARVSAYPCEVTAQMVGGFLSGTAAISAFARTVRAEVYVANFGVAAEIADAPNLINVPIARGTRNFVQGPAMSAPQVDAAIEAGVALFERLQGTQQLEIIALGEMGIGNTTSAAALICALTGTAPEDIVGRGTGVDDATLQRKIAAVATGVARCDKDDWHQCAQQVGGFEILGLAGIMLAAAQAGIPIILDGYIVTAAALVASRIAPEVVPYCIASHRSRELGHAYVLRHLGLLPLFDLDLRLGEATGAALAFPFIEAAARMIREMKTFAEAGVSTASAEPEALTVS